MKLFLIIKRFTQPWMNTFLELNRDKLKSIFVRLALIFLGLVSIALTVAYSTENFLTAQLLPGIILAAGIGFPLLIMFIGYIVWLLRHNARQTAFVEIPFNEIEKSVSINPICVPIQNNRSLTR
jgi:cbb3-type cytochrome oxidase subunit 3